LYLQSKTQGRLSKNYKIPPVSNILILCSIPRRRTTRIDKTGSSAGRGCGRPSLQSPYPAELAEAAARRQLEEELFPEEDEWLSAKLGITGRYRDSYEKMRVEMKQEPENPLFQGNVALAVQQRLKRNFRSGYWEAMIVHTKPLSVVPPDMRAGRIRQSS